MRSLALKPLLGAFLVSVLLVTEGYANTAEPVNLKQTMKQMRLFYKNALESDSAAGFNHNLTEFKTLLSSAQSYNFSPERKAVSLEGLAKVERLVTEIPPATAENLITLQHKLSEVDALRKEYHKKAKPGIWELLMSFFR